MNQKGKPPKFSVNTPTPVIHCDLSSLLITAEQAFEQLGMQAGDMLGARERFVMRGALSKAKQLIRPCGVWRIFECRRLSRTGEYYLPEVGTVILGKTMPDFFQDVPYMAMLAVTIGPELEHFANVIGTGGDAAGQVILDSIGSLAVEMAADDLSNRLRVWAGERCLHTSMRYSPGYGDLLLSTQTVFARLLEMKETVGITLLHNEILQPFKSITAFTALRTAPFENEGKERDCRDCNLIEHCDRRVCNR